MNENWERWEKQVVNGIFPLRRSLRTSDHSAVFLTEHKTKDVPDALLKLVPAIPTLRDAQLSHWSLAARLSHPCLVRLLDTGSCQIEGLQFLFVVTEYAEQTLAQILQQRALAPQELRKMLRPILDALSFLHRKRLVQGGLKPSNLLIVKDRLKLASDAVRPAGESTASIAPPSVFDPPESRDGSFSSAGDVWSLGVLIVEALTQKRPVWLDKSAEAVLPETLPASFVAIVRRCLNRNPAHRPSVEELDARINPMPRMYLVPSSRAERSPSLVGLTPSAVVPPPPVIYPELDAEPQPRLPPHLQPQPQAKLQSQSQLQSQRQSQLQTQLRPQPPPTAFAPAAVLAAPTSFAPAAVFAPPTAFAPAAVFAPPTAFAPATVFAPPTAFAPATVLASPAALTPPTAFAPATVLAPPAALTPLTPPTSFASPTALAPPTPLTPPTARTNRPPKRHSFLVGAALIVTVVLGAAWAGAILLSSQEYLKPAASSAANSRDAGTSMSAASGLVTPSPGPDLIGLAAAAEPVASTVPAMAAVPDEVIGPRSVLHQELPDVPQKAIETIHGRMLFAVRVTVDRSGNVIRAAVAGTRASKYFARLSGEAARKWRFAPADNLSTRRWLLQFEFTRAGVTVRAS